MKGNRLIYIFILIAILIAGIGYFYINNLKEKQVNSKLEEYIPEEEFSENEMKKTMVNLYFYNNDKGELEKESRIINAIDLIENPYIKLIELLIEGPKSEKLKTLMPTDVKVFNAEINDGCVTLDMSIELLNHTEDIDLKNKMINSIVDTLTQLTEVESVRFLINGEENEIFSKEYFRECLDN